MYNRSSTWYMPALHHTTLLLCYSINTAFHWQDTYLHTCIYIIAEHLPMAYQYEATLGGAHTEHVHVLNVHSPIHTHYTATYMNIYCKASLQWTNLISVQETISSIIPCLHEYTYTASWLNCYMKIKPATALHIDSYAWFWLHCYVTLPCLVMESQPYLGP